MSSRVELVPLANTREVSLNEEGPSNERLDEFDEGFNSGVDPDLRNGNGFDTRHSPKPPLEPEGYPEEFPLKPKGRRPLDVNLYATKKTVAQGMMDLALLTANANQLRYVLESGNTESPYYYLSVVLICLSIVLQLLIGIALIFLGRYDMLHHEAQSKADRLNNWIVLGVFLITSVNVFISAFGIDPIEPIDPVLIVDATLQSMKDKGRLDNL